jgi:hypothetical protein
MLGYMTKKKALQLGFTHHGSYFGVPIYIGDPDGKFMVTTKHWALDPLFDLMSAMEGWLRPIIYPDSPDTFQFKLGAEIK